MGVLENAQHGLCNELDIRSRRWTAQQNKTGSCLSCWQQTAHSRIRRPDMAPRWLGKFQGFIAVTCDVTIQSSKHDITKVALGTLTAGHYAQSSAEEQNIAISLAPAGCLLQAGCPSLVGQGRAAHRNTGSALRPDEESPLVGVGA
jgi:hypothetical protein